MPVLLFYLNWLVVFMCEICTSDLSYYRSYINYSTLEYVDYIACAVLSVHFFLHA